MIDPNQALIQVLQPHATEKTAAFSAKLVPTLNPSRFLGVKSAPLRTTAKALLAGQLAVTPEEFRAAAPHPYVELDIIHMHTLNALKDPTHWQSELEKFLPHIDNWMVTDALDPALLRSKKSIGTSQAQTVLTAGHTWLASCDTYTIRTGVLVLLQALAKGHFTPDHLHWVAATHHDNYYVHMAVGWYFATAFDKQEAATRPYLETPGHLQLESHRLAIRKIIESRRTTPENLQWARSLRTHLTQLAHLRKSQSAHPDSPHAPTVPPTPEPPAAAE